MGVPVCCICETVSPDFSVRPHDSVFSVDVIVNGVGPKEGGIKAISISISPHPCFITSLVQ